MKSRGKVEARLGTRLAVLLLAGGLLVTGCTASSSAEGDSQDSKGPAASAPPEPASLSLIPENGAGNVAPGEPVTVGVTSGALTEARLVGADGTVVKGAKHEDGSGWSSTEELGYGKTYTLTATATGAGGKPVTEESTFTTATPNRQVGVWTNIDDGQTVGVGMPLIFTFTRDITDRAAAERALRIKTEPNTIGDFHWFSDRRVIWRPKEYWASGTKVTVNTEIYGIDLGNGTFGKQDKSMNITVGDKIVAIADGTSHQMEVLINDEEVRTMPLAMGKASSPTPEGAYTVMSEHRGFTMDSSTYGVPVDSPAGYKLTVDIAVRMSNSGIFYHSAPWSVWAQGERNVSHGCINLSYQNAKWLMDRSQPGDIIVVRNSGGAELQPTDGWSVWQMSWDDWTATPGRN